jgi:hypothetical protein
MNPNPLDGNGTKPLSFRDAALVSTILTVVLVFTAFMTSHGFNLWVANPAQCVYDIIVFVGTSWITEFVTLTGLGYYVKRQKEAAP